MSLAGRSEMVPGSGDVSEGPVPLYFPLPTPQTDSISPRSEALKAADLRL